MNCPILPSHAFNFIIYFKNMTLTEDFLGHMHISSVHFCLLPSFTLFSFVCISKSIYFSRIPLMTRRCKNNDYLIFRDCSI